MQNYGEFPINPQDMVESLGVKTEYPWKIINVVNPSGDTFIPVKWHRESDIEFRIEKTLINPGDTIRSTAYITLSGNSQNTELNTKPPLKFVHRISNLRAIEPHTSYADRHRWSFIMVMIWDWGILFTVSSYVIYHIYSISLLYKSKIISDIRISSMLIISAIGGLNLLGAVAGTALVFGAGPYSEEELSNFAYIFFFGNLMAMFFLYFWSRKSGAKQPSP